MLLKKYRQEKEDFSTYLFSIGDSDTLYILGVINKHEERVSRKNTFFEVEEKLFDKFNETKDSRYFEFQKNYKFYAKIKITFFIVIIFATLFFVIFRECIS